LNDIRIFISSRGMHMSGSALVQNISDPHKRRLNRE